MNKGNIVVRPCGPKDHEAWLNLLAEICVSSPAWEAVYLEKPSFHRDFDLVAEEDGKLIGALAGHLISAKPQDFWSAEVLGVHPEYQKKGVGKKLLESASQFLKFKGDRMLLWTCCPEARKWYQKLGCPEIEKRSLDPISVSEGELHLLRPDQLGKKLLWAFAFQL